MLHYLAEDPWPLAGALAVLALVFYVRLRVNQDVRELHRMLATLGVAALLLIVEQFWVTDNERIEALVYDLARGVGNSDAREVTKLFAPQISFGLRDRTNLMEVDPDRFGETLKTLEFDWLRVTRVKTHAGEQTKAGTADFRVNASGSVVSPFGVRFNFATGNSEWSVGVKKMPDGVWKITRINPVNIPQHAVNTVDSYIRMVTRGGTSPAPQPRGPRPSFGPGGPPDRSRPSDR